MRLKKLSLEQFRCFSKTELDLSADVTAIYGRNGIGKTVIFDAIELALLGDIDRFCAEANAPDYLSRVFGNCGSRVRLEFDQPQGLWIEESWPRDHRSDSTFDSNGEVRGRTNFLYHYILDADASPRREIVSAREFFRSVVILSQETMRSFVTLQPADRERVVSYLVGAGALQRCLDKAKDVASLAEGRRKSTATERGDAEQQHMLLKSQLLEQQTRLAELVEEVGKDRVTFTTIQEELGNAGILSVHATREPRPEEVPAFAQAVKGACDERCRPYEDLLTRLSRVETGLPQYRVQAKRHRELMLLRDETNKKIESLLNEENATFKGTTTIRREREAVAAAAKQTRLRIAAAERTPQLQARLRSVQATLATAAEQQQRLQEQLRSEKAREDALASECAAIRAELGDLGRQVTSLREQVTEIAGLESRLPAYLSAVALAEKLGAQITQLRSDQDVLAKQREELTTKEREYREHLSEITGRLSRQKSERQYQAALVTALRERIRGPKCPLCGHKHGSLAALLSAVDAQLTDVPGEEAQIAKEHTACEAALAEQRSRLSVLDARLAEIACEMERTRSRLSDQSHLIDGFRTDAAKTGIAAEERAVLKAASDRKQALEAAMSRLSQASERAQLAQPRCLSAQAAVESIARGLAEADRQAADARNVHEAISAEVASSGASEFIQRASEDLDSAVRGLRSQLADQEARARSLDEAVSKEEASWSAIRDERTRLEASVREWQGTLGSLDKEIQTFLLTVRACGLEADIAVDAIRQRKESAIAARDRLLRLAALAEKYERGARADALQRETDDLQRQADKLADERKTRLRQERKLAQAMRLARRWASAIGRSLGECVEMRLREYQTIISNRFRGMIPSPDVFEGICVQRGSAGVSLGLKYSDVGAVGEPRFFLSSAQANVLALATFLSFADTQTWSHLDTILLDDPVQQLDDLDAVAFLDLLRAMSLGSRKKQIILSTCSKDLYLLVIRKFLALQQVGRISLTGISLLDGGITGPNVIYDIGGPGKVSLPAAV